MNIFRSLIGKVWHDPNTAEVVKISEGQLYLVRSGTVRSDRECIFNDAMLTIRRTTTEHNFQLVVTRVFEEGDQELLEDEEETDDERVFLIGEELEFRKSETLEGEPSFIWRDLEGDVDEFYEFVASGTNEPTRAFFETCMYRAMYERKYRRSADNTTDTDLQEFIWQPPAKKEKKGPRKKVTTSAVEETPATTSAVAVEPESDSDTDSQPAEAPKETKPIVIDDDDEYETLVATPSELHLWDADNAFFTPQADVIARIVRKRDSGPFDYWLIAATEDGDKMLAHPLSSEMNPRWARVVYTITWNHMRDPTTMNSWCLRFKDSEDFESFQKVFVQCMWEHLNELPFGKAKAEEQTYVLSSVTEDVEMQDVEDDEDEEDAVESELDKEEDESETEDEPFEDEDGLEKLPAGRNSQLTVGYKGDRSYVVRENNIGVFSHTGENVKYHATISKLTTPKGKEFKPKQVMLHQQDSKMILMNPAEPHSLFSMDIERGKIVEEWKVNENINVDHMAPDSKFAQMTPEQTLVGASHNALFRIDPRISGNKMVDSQYKQYVSKNKFSGVATTDAGKLAVASEKGDIRLFDTIGKNAKTALPPLGDPIIGIDVTANGRWIVATTKTYLLLIDTLIGEGRYTGQLGFDRSFPANAKPIPKRLQLRAEHVAYMEHSVSFTPARFNMGEGQEENAIVTSTGQFVVAWDFKKVRKGQLDKYEIKKYEDLVVQDNFKFGDDKEIIVALQNNVLAVNKKSLKRPTRASLATPRRSVQSSSDIVNAPY
ncbi:VID27-domain-containing protein [Panus rudis PR-1116 ss-1]|nr:VID27-domain-containing protein [Panus rudis PR-1116 ss-1]